MLDPGRDIGRLGQAKPDELAPRIAGRQRGSHTAGSASPPEDVSKFLVERQFVPRAVDPGDDGRSVQALESRAVELDRGRVAGQRRPEGGR